MAEEVAMKDVIRGVYAVIKMYWEWVRRIPRLRDVRQEYYWTKWRIRDA